MGLGLTPKEIEELKAMLLPLLCSLYENMFADVKETK